jgi:DNA-3-methyladenine glycosylase II|tara:strand:+ start:105 stop:707 length:603 start_codon:yes stop_codon:yes gene_type:complete
MTKKVLHHFQKVDPVMYTAIQSIQLEEVEPVASQQYFQNLCRSIAGQQLTGKAAETIFGRFRELFLKKKVTPKGVLSVSGDTMRGAGLSWAKVWSIQDFAAKVSSREVRLKGLRGMADEEVIEELTKVRGIGPWTAEMFLMFTLGREDVFSVGDLGLRRGMERLYRLAAPTQEEMLAIAAKWSPYRSWGSRALWRFIDGK